MQLRTRIFSLPSPYLLNQACSHIQYFDRIALNPKLKFRVKARFSLLLILLDWVSLACHGAIQNIIVSIIVRVTKTFPRPQFIYGGSNKLIFCSSGFNVPSVNNSLRPISSVFRGISLLLLRLLRFAMCRNYQHSVNRNHNSLFCHEIVSSGLRNDPNQSESRVLKDLMNLI